MKNSSVLIGVVILMLNAIQIGCEEEGEGTLGLEIWGEAFIEEGIPSNEFADGFSVSFDKFLINLGNILIAQEGQAPEVVEPVATIWNLTQTGPFEIASAIVPEGAYDDTRFQVAKATSSSTPGNAEQADVQMMIDAGFSVYVAGTANDGTTTKTFYWGFETETDYGPCHSLANLEDGGEAMVQITIHGDHFFYDDAVTETPDLRFNDIALADVDGDDEVTANELADYDIMVLPNYGVGNFDIYNLWDFISHMATTLGHIDGEGHCH